MFCHKRSGTAVFVTNDPLGPGYVGGAIRYRQTRARAAVRWSFMRQGPIFNQEFLWPGRSTWSIGNWKPLGSVVAARAFPFKKSVLLAPYSSPQDLQQITHTCALWSVPGRVVLRTSSWL